MIETMLEEAAIEVSLHNSDLDFLQLYFLWSKKYNGIIWNQNPKHKNTFDPRWKSGRRQSRCEHRGGEPMTPEKVFRKGTVVKYMSS